MTADCVTAGVNVYFNVGDSGFHQGELQTDNVLHVLLANNLCSAGKEQQRGGAGVSELILPDKHHVACTSCQPSVALVGDCVRWR